MGRWVKCLTFGWVTWVMGQGMVTYDPSLLDYLSMAIVKQTR